MKKCRGRPKCPRRVEQTPDVTYFKPRGVPLSDLEVVSLTVEELEALRLVDIEGLRQEDTAGRCRRQGRNIKESFLGGSEIRQNESSYCPEHRKSHRNKRRQLYQG